MEPRDASDRGRAADGRARAAGWRRLLPWGRLSELPAPTRYGMALAATGLALAGSLKMEGVIRGVPFMFFFAAVTFAGWFGGTGPGAAAIAMSAVLANYYFLPPYRGIIPLDGDTLVRLALFLVVASLINGLNGARHAQVRRAEEAVRARDTFLMIAAHELRTPITAMKLRLEALMRAAQRGDREGRAEPAPERLEQGLAAAGRQVQRLQNLVEELLDATRIAAGPLVLDPATHDVAEIARAAAATLAGGAAAAGTSITVDAPAPAEARCDASRIERVVLNLLSNAIRYGGGSPVSVRVEADAREVRVSVRDGGIGIAPADAPRIFEPYERAASPRHYGGLGLGLHIARQIVIAHGGSIAVESAPGAGSTFTVRLPRG